MRLYLFLKAKFLVGTVRKVYEDENSIRLKIGKFEVKFWYENHKLKVWCNCRAASMHPELLCSHAIAGISYLTKWVK